MRREAGSCKGFSLVPSVCWASFWSSLLFSTFGGHQLSRVWTDPSLGCWLQSYDCFPLGSCWWLLPFPLPSSWIWVSESPVQWACLLPLCLLRTKNHRRPQITGLCFLKDRTAQSFLPSPFLTRDLNILLSAPVEPSHAFLSASR